MYSVLILDDNKPIATQIFKTIPWDELNCHVVGVRHDGNAGRKAIEQYKPDIIISDVEMPGLSGLQMIELTKQFIPDTKIIFISAYDRFSYAHSALRLGACEYLLKPFTGGEMRRAIDKAISQIEKTGSGIHKTEDTGQYSLLMQSILAYIKVAAYESISLESVAGRFDISASKLGRLIRKEMGIRFSELITRIRLDRAKELLEIPNLAVSDIAERVGYCDYLSFYKAFVRNEKISPSDYRRRSAIPEDGGNED